MSQNRTRFNHSALQNLLSYAIKNERLGILKLLVPNNHEILAPLSRQSLRDTVENQVMLQRIYSDKISRVCNEEILSDCLSNTLYEFKCLVNAFNQNGVRNENDLMNKLNAKAKEKEAKSHADLMTRMESDVGSKFVIKGIYYRLGKKENEFTLSAIEDKNRTYKVELPDKSTQEYYTIAVSGSKNAGLTALKIDKKDLIDVLMKAITLPDNRERLALEIESVLMDLSFKSHANILSPIEQPAANRLLSNEWNKLYINKVKLTEKFEGSTDAIKRAQLLDEIKMQNQLIQEYCKRKIICKEYISEYDKPASHLWLGKQSASLYCRGANRTLFVFDCRKGRLHLDENASHCKVNQKPICLMYDDYGHFKILQDINKKVSPDTEQAQVYINWFKKRFDKIIKPFLTLPANSDWNGYLQLLNHNKDKALEKFSKVLDDKDKITNLQEKAQHDLACFLAYQEEKKELWGALEEADKQAIKNQLKGNLDDESFYHNVIENLAVSPNFLMDEGNSLLTVVMSHQFHEGAKYLTSKDKNGNSKGANVLQKNKNGDSPFLLGTRQFAYHLDDSHKKELYFRLWEEAMKFPSSAPEIDARYNQLLQVSKSFYKFLDDLAEYKKIQEARMSNDDYYNGLKSTINCLLDSDKTSQRLLTVGKIYSFAEEARKNHDYPGFIRNMRPVLRQMEYKGNTGNSELYKRLKQFLDQSEVLIRRNITQYMDDYHHFCADRERASNEARNQTLLAAIDTDLSIQKNRRDLEEQTRGYQPDQRDVEQALKEQKDEYEKELGKKGECITKQEARLDEQKAQLDEQKQKLDNAERIKKETDDKHAADIERVKQEKEKRSDDQKAEMQKQHEEMRKSQDDKIKSQDDKIKFQDIKLQVQDDGIQALRNQFNMVLASLNQPGTRAPTEPTTREGSSSPRSRMQMFSSGNR